MLSSGRCTAGGWNRHSPIEERVVLCERLAANIREKSDAAARYVCGGSATSSGGVVRMWTMRQPHRAATALCGVLLAGTRATGRLFSLERLLFRGQVRGTGTGHHLEAEIKLYQHGLELLVGFAVAFQLRLA